MSRALGFVGLLIVLGLGAYIYMRQAQSVTPGGGAAGSTATPRSTIDVVGVKNDLNALASAERRHFAADGKYVSIDELRSNGDISMPTDHRGPYSYSAETSDTGFRITATYSGPPNAGVPNTLSIDETMQLKMQ
jgi:hypothetical protein